MYKRQLFTQLEIAWGIFLQTSPIMLDRVYHSNSYQIALYYFVNGLCAMLSIFIVQPWFEKRFTYESATKALAFITAIFMCLLSIKTSYAAFTSIMFMMTFFEFLLFTSLLVQISNTASKDSKGMVMGMVSSLIGISFLISDVFMLVVSESSIAQNFLFAALILPFYKKPNLPFNYKSLMTR